MRGVWGEVYYWYLSLNTMKDFYEMIFCKYNMAEYICIMRLLLTTPIICYV